MPKPLQRACLEQGLRLDLNWLVRNGLVRPGEWMPELKFSWKLDRTDREPSLGLLTSNMEGNEGHLRIQIGKIDQIIKLAANERSFWWPAVVFHLSGFTKTVLDHLETAWSQSIC